MSIENLDPVHLPFVKADIIRGIRKETAEEIKAAYPIEEQLNGLAELPTADETRAAEINAMIADIKAMREASWAKRDAVEACTTFEELVEIVPTSD